MPFAVSLDYEDSPERIDLLEEGVETPQRLDLRTVPLDTVVIFYGLHPDSKYVAKVIGPESERRIKIWFKGNVPAAIGSIEDIFSWESKLEFKTRAIGVMEVGKNYYLPHFYYRLGKPNQLIIDPLPRTEPYTKIFVKKP